MALATSTEVKCAEVATTPYDGQKPGTSGLRKKVRWGGGVGFFVCRQSKVFHPPSGVVRCE